jgi:hypothetical protein
MRMMSIVVSAVAAMALLAGCSDGGTAQSQPAQASASSAASTSAGSQEAYQAVVKDLAESEAYKELTSAVIAYLDNDPVARWTNGDYESLRQDADNLKELAGKVPAYDGDDATAILAYQHAQRYAQEVTSSAEAYADAKTPEDVSAATTLFGAAYDEAKELTRMINDIRG